MREEIRNQIVSNMGLILGEAYKPFVSSILDLAKGPSLDYRTFNTMMKINPDSDISPYVPEGFKAHVDFVNDKPRTILDPTVDLPAIIISRWGMINYVYGSNIDQYQGPMIALMRKRLFHQALVSALDVIPDSAADQMLIDAIADLPLGRLLQRSDDYVFVNAHSQRVTALLPRGLHLRTFKNDTSKLAYDGAEVGRSLLVDVAFNGKVFEGTIVQKLHKDMGGVDLNRLSGVVKDRKVLIKYVEDQIIRNLAGCVSVPVDLAEKGYVPTDFFDFSITEIE